MTGQKAVTSTRRVRRLALALSVACGFAVIAGDAAPSAAPQARNATEQSAEAPAAAGAGTRRETAPRAAPGEPGPRAVLQRYCFACHNQRTLTAGLALDVLDLSRAGEHPEVWEAVIRKLRTGAMPPAGRPRPDNAVYDSPW